MKIMITNLVKFSSDLFYSSGFHHHALSLLGGDRTDVLISGRRAKESLVTSIFDIFADTA
jgi:hypothetical protein